MSAVERLNMKLARRGEKILKLTRVFVPAHESVSAKGTPYHVKGYFYEKKGGSSVPKPGQAEDVPEAPGAPRDTIPDPTPKDLKAREEAIKKGAVVGSKERPIITDDVSEAAKLLGEGQHVRLNRPQEVSTLLDKLAEMVADAKSKGEKAPTYDLCKVSVANTNLFCAESKGIPRVQMPQLGGIPKPGSRADKFPRNQFGEVDLSEEFAKHLADHHTEVKDEDIDASFLKASQNELNGAKVAGIAKAIEEGKFDPTRGRIWTSNDDYVIDGHHRWAATVAEEISAGKEIKIQIHRVDMDIISILQVANNWAAEMGIEQASVSGAPAPPEVEKKSA